MDVLYPVNMVTAGHIAAPHRRYPLWGSLLSLS